MRLILIADSHVAARAPAFTDNARAACAWIDGAGADLVVHLGDVTADGVRHASEFANAAKVFGALKTPLQAVPGNHDIGDGPPGGGVKEPAVDPDRLAAFRRALGPDRWARDEGGWTLIGLNALLMGGDSDEERAQETWLDEVLAKASTPVAVFLHKPLFRDGPYETVDHPRFVAVDARRRLLSRFETVDLRLVASGHVHQARDFSLDGVRHLWAPSCAFVIPDTMQERIGDKRVGLTVLDFDQDGAVTVSTVTPPGVLPHDIADHRHLYPAAAPAASR